MNKYTFYCGTGATLTVEAQTPEEALASLFPKAVLGYYEQPANEPPLGPAQASAAAQELVQIEAERTAKSA
jgi:hypothetical protein